jgi:casein kinase II subunit beta
MELSESTSEEESYSTSGGEEFDGDDATWVEWFCSQKGNEFYVEVEEDYINDDFNLTGLSSQVPWFDEALNLILDCDEEDDVDTDSLPLVEAAAVILYGLIHARYLLTTRGQQALLEKHKTGLYGTCTNAVCDVFKQKMLPIGSDISKQGATRVFCPCCNEIYFPRNAKLENIDGAHFGSSASHILIMTNPQLASTYVPNVALSPKLYGFRTALTAPTRENIRASIADRSLAVEVGKPSPDTVPDSDST